MIGTKGCIRSINNGDGIKLRKAGDMVGKRQGWDDAEIAPVAPKSHVVSCLEDLIDAYEQGRPTLGHVEVAHHITEHVLPWRRVIAGGVRGLIYRWKNGICTSFTF